MDIVGFITSLGVLAILAVIFAESGLLIGFFFPGDSLLFTSGVLIQSGIINFNIHIFAILVFIAAVLGDNTGYAFGRRVGKHLFNREDSRLFKQEYLQKSQDFYDKHGALTIVLARFIPVVRTFTPVVAGASHMNYRKFLSYNLIGGLLWGVGNTYIGYSLGILFEQMGIKTESVMYPIVAIIILSSLIPPLWHLSRDPKSRQILATASKRQWQQILNKIKRLK